MNILALGNWNWTTDWLQNLCAFLLIFIVCVGNLDRVALLSLHILALFSLNFPALLLWHILALHGRNSMALLSRLIPAFLTWFIPALLLSIFINTFSFSNSLALLLSNSSANLLMGCSALSLVHSVALCVLHRVALLIPDSLTLLIITILGNFLLDSLAIHMRNIMALGFLLKITLVLGYIISFGFSSWMTNLLMFSVAMIFIHSLALLGVSCVTFLIILSVTFLFIFSLTLFFRNFLTLLLRDRLSFGNFDSVTLFFVLIIYFSVPHSFALLFIVSGALFLVGGHIMWYLDSVTLLSGLIPALVLPDSGAGGYPTVGATQKKQQSQNLHIC